MTEDSSWVNIDPTETTQIYQNVRNLRNKIEELLRAMEASTSEKTQRRLRFLNKNILQLIDLTENMKTQEFDYDSERKANQMYCDMLPFMLYKMCAGGYEDDDNVSQDS